MGTSIHEAFQRYPETLDSTSGKYIRRIYPGYLVSGEKGDDFMNISETTGQPCPAHCRNRDRAFHCTSRAGRCAGMVVWHQGTPGSTTSAQPALTTVSGPYALGSVSAYGGVSSRSPSSHIDYFETVSASGKITSFAFSFHYEG